jgi:PAS domain S-box-containing protein
MRDQLWQTVVLMAALLFGTGACVGLAWRQQRVRFYRERAETAEALRASEERFRRAVVDSPFPILLHAENGAILQASNTWCEITGYTREELPTIADWTERAYGERKALVQADIDALYRLDRRKYEGDYVIRTKSGDRRIWEFSAAPLGRLPDGRRLVISMATDVTERRAAEREVRQLNAELEQRVRDRTAELEVANKELESFAYSVSHDLRAPLRGIDGWSQALVEDYRDKLDAQGREYLAQVCSEAQRMGQLIDDMLELSRVTRAGMRREPVDLSALARGSLAHLRQQDGQRQVETIVAPGLTATGDPQLLRLVLENLLGNAWKFTGKRREARIEFGTAAAEATKPAGPGAETRDQKSETDQSLLTSAATVFFVRDNGAGFDMAHARKLFAPFQRLHRLSEFPGTGVGLATVQRIIHRHGGRVWAQAEREKGATFYFSLPVGKE